MGERPDTFMRREWPFVAGLESWLDKATGGLCAEAVERICREVVEHCKESIEGKLAAGMPLAEVDRVVMSELGSWRAARRAFRKTNLTYIQDLWVKAFLERQSLQKGLLMLLPTVLGLGIVEALVIFLESPVSFASTTLPIILFGLTPQWGIPLLQRVMGMDSPHLLIRRFVLLQCAIACIALPWLLIAAGQFRAVVPVLGEWFQVLASVVPTFVMCALPYQTWSLQYKLPKEAGEAKR